MLLGIGIIHHVNFLEIVRHPWFMSSFLATLSAHIIKLLITRFKKGVWDWREMKASGGMPSSHSAIVAAVTTAVGIRMGFNSALFAISLTMALITMTDAAGVRRAAGQQAVVLNRVVQEMIENGGDLPEQTLKELLGHTPFQVLVGALIGTILAILIA